MLVRLFVIINFIKQGMIVICSFSAAILNNYFILKTFYFQTHSTPSYVIFIYMLLFIKMYIKYRSTL